MMLELYKKVKYLLKKTKYGNNSNISNPMNNNRMETKLKSKNETLNKPLQENY